ncbi:hypothetical protein [Cellulosilyticum ruminicola]
MGQIIDLNFDWQYKINFKEDDLDILKGNIQMMNLPYLPKIDCNEYKNDEISLNGNVITSYYEKCIEITKRENEENLLLCFDGIRGEVQVYINGILAKQRYITYGYFEANITKFVKYNAVNKISVVIKGEEGGAIYAPVYLKHKLSAYIENVGIITKNVLEAEKEVEVAIEIVGLVEGMNVQAAIMDQKGNVIANAVSNPLRSLTPRLNMKTTKAEIWDVEDPVLYDLHILLQCDAHIVDEVIIPFGFRQAEFKADGFYLNGRKLKLCGVSKGDGLESTDYTPVPALEAYEACMIKRDLNMNMVKLTGESVTPSFLKKCDEIGLLVFVELPKWAEQEGLIDEEAICKDEFEQFIKAYRNYTGLILWGIGKIDIATNYDLQTHGLLKQFDPTRAIGGQTYETSLIDVYTYDDNSYTDGGDGLEEPDKVAPSDEIPYLVSSHTGNLFPTKNFDIEERRTEFALRHMRVLDEMMASERICGVIAKSYVDEAYVTYAGGRRKICYTGVLDSERQFKLAAYAYASQQDENFVMEVSSNMQGEEGSVVGGIYVFTNCDSVKLYKDDRYIGEFYPDKEEFPNLIHPPVYIDDYIGESLVTEEGYSPKDAAIIKSILMAMATNEGDVSLDLKGKLMFVRFKSKMNKETIHGLYEKYILDVQKAKAKYIFEGYKDGEKVGTVTKGGYTPARIFAEAGRHQLILGETYDATRIIIKAVDENDNVLPYINEVVRVETSGSIEIIGHTYHTLVGGNLAVYVRTKGETGTGIVSIKSNALGEGQLVFQVSRQESK